MKSDSTKPKKPAKPKKAKPFVVRDFASVKHTYDRTEREQITSKLTSAVQNAAELDGQAKAVSKDFKAKIETQKSIITEATNQLTNGYEMQQVEVEVHMDRKKGFKRLLNYAPGKADHRKFIREEKMTEADYQRLPIEVVPPKPEEKKKGKANELAVFNEEELAQAFEVIRVEQKASVSLIQRRTKFNYSKSAAIMDEMEKRGVVGPSKGSEPRDILLEDFSAGLPKPKPAEKTDENPPDENQPPPGEPAV